MPRQFADEGVVDIGHQRRPLDRRHPLGDFFHIVDFNIAKDRDGCQRVYLLPFRIGNIFKVKDEIVVIFCRFGLQVFIDDAVVPFANVFKEVARFPPKFINFQIGHDVIQLLIIVDIAYPVAKNAVGPAQIGLHIDDGNADGKVLHGIGRRLIDAARNGIEKLAYFSAAFIMILAGQDVGTAGQDDCQQGNDPIVDGNDKNQQDSNQEKRAVRPS